MYAADDGPVDLDVTVVVKKLAGKSGCTRMVQGGYNAVLHSEDSVEDHYMDTIEGGKWINDQKLAWTLVENAPKVIRKLENDLGVFFDRDEDGHIHQKPFAGQSFDRTVHKGDLTGIEIMTKIRDELLTRDVTFLEETRAVDLLTRDGEAVGAVVLDMRSGEFEVITAKAVVLATGGGATMYSISTPALEKSADGQAMAYRQGLPLQDMEMMQFHPTGLLAGDTKLTGGVIEEGIRGEGAHLYNTEDERFMEKYAPEKMERATRDIVSRASYEEIMAGRGTERGGVLLDATHLGTEFVEETFPGMTERTRNVGQDLSTQRVEVSPTSHYHMGGVTIDANCRTNLPGLFVAGEDAGGAHGANRLGGNGVVDSTVLGKQAGQVVPDRIEGRSPPSYDPDQAERIIERITEPLNRPGGADVYELRDELEEVMWEYVGVVRTGEKLEEGIERLVEIRKRLEDVAVSGSRRYNLEWNEYMDLENLALIAETVARSALYRTESRGAHYREDYPERDDDEWLANVHVRRNDDGMETWKEDVVFSQTHPANVDGSIVTVSDNTHAESN
ncbi:FAD-binding protein [Halosolutus halophilus]|uniref:FAD-binding protein n=1 Tax=Halosolutus halophilus TaxID=1552990 RepID=UPI0022350E1F|nr:FAD-binding protein [Halosolutus halophilus]